MTELLSLDLVRKGLVTDQMVLTIGYEHITDPALIRTYSGGLYLDHYGRIVPKHAAGTANLHRHTASTQLIISAVTSLYERIADPLLPIRRINICACRVVPESSVRTRPEFEQLDLFTDYEELERTRLEEEQHLEKEKALQLATLEIKEKFGKNAILKGTNFLEGAMTRQRNQWIGGHRA